MCVALDAGALPMKQPGRCSQSRPALPPSMQADAAQAASQSGRPAGDQASRRKRAHACKNYHTRALLFIAASPAAPAQRRPTAPSARPSPQRRGLGWPSMPLSPAEEAPPPLPKPAPPASPRGSRAANAGRAGGIMRSSLPHRITRTDLIGKEFKFEVIRGGYYPPPSPSP